jgi:hypothetical protein
MRTGFAEGSSQPRRLSMFSCDMAVHPAVPASDPFQIWMKIQEPRPGKTGLAL